MEFTQKTTVKNKTAGKNSCQFIILHHTGGGSFQSNMNFLSKNSKVSSVHFVVGENGEAGKIGDPRDILWHAGESQRGKLVGMNQYSLGIEIVGPNNSGDRCFSDAQYDKVVELVKHLMNAFSIPKQNVLKHSDITWAGSKDQLLWDGKSKARKVDVDRRLWAERGFKNFNDWKNAVL